MHRAENTNYPERLRSIIEALDKISRDMPVIFSVHPRTRKIIETSFPSLVIHPSLIITEPVSYFDMLILEKNARAILIDSGGVQKEAYWLKVPCITLRDETEWIETVEGTVPELRTQRSEVLDSGLSPSCKDIFR